jgi:molecular chaperone DnaK (HSP70)
LSAPVANEQGSYTTPSFVSFTDKERLIGEAAKNTATMNPRNTIFDIKCVLLSASPRSAARALFLDKHDTNSVVKPGV